MSFSTFLESDVLASVKFRIDDSNVFIRVIKHANTIYSQIDVVLPEKCETNHHQVMLSINEHELQPFTDSNIHEELCFAINYLFEFLPLWKERHEFKC